MNKEEEIKLFSKNWDKVKSAIRYYSKNYDNETGKILIDFIESDNKSWHLKSYAAKAIGQNSISEKTFESLLKVFCSTNSSDFKPKCEMALKIMASKINLSQNKVYTEFLEREKLSNLAFYNIRNLQVWTEENWHEKVLVKSDKIVSKFKNQWSSKWVKGKIRCTDNITAIIECLISAENITVRTGIKTKMIHVAANMVNESPYFTGLKKGIIDLNNINQDIEESKENVSEYLEELKSLEERVRNCNFQEAALLMPDITHKIKFEPEEFTGVYSGHYLAVLNFSIADKTNDRSKKIAKYIKENEDWANPNYLDHIIKHGH